MENQVFIMKKNSQLKIKSQKYILKTTLLC